MASFGVIAFLFLLLTAFCQATPMEAPGTQYCESLDVSDQMFNQTDVNRSPTILDCGYLAMNLATDFTVVLDGQQYILASNGSCHFAATGAASVIGPNVNVTIGATDISNKINDAIMAFVTYGRVGASGRFHCRQCGAPDNSNAYMFQVGWAIS